MARIKRINKSDVRNMDYVNTVLEASASSCKFGPMRCHQGANGKYITRTSINALLLMPFGAGKTSSLIKIENAVFVNEFTSPAILGSISKDGKLVKGSVLQAGGKVLIIDEVQNLHDDARRGTLSLLEYPHEYTRSLGFKLNEPFTTPETPDNPNYRYYKITAFENTVKIFARFSCIASGMYLKLSETSQLDLAWLSRFIPIKMRISSEFIRNLTLGKKQININPRQKDMDFEFRNYLDFHKDYFEKVKSLPFYNYFEAQDRMGFMSRNLMDMARLSCFYASLEDRTSPKREDWELALRFVPLSMYNFMTMSLTDVEYCIIHNYGVKSQKEIADISGTTESNISHRIVDLRRKGLIKGEHLEAFQDVVS